MGIVRRLLLGRDHGLRARLRARLRRLAGRPPEAPPAPAPAVASPSAAPRGAGAPEGFTAVMHFADLAQGRPCEVMVAGRPVVLALVGDTVHAVVGTCPHAGGPLAEGTLVGTTLTCPMHGWSFDLVTGSCHVNPEDRIGILRVHVADGVVHVGDGVAA